MTSPRLFVLSLLAISLAGPRTTELNAQDCNSNGELDSVEISAGLAADCNTNGVPDECDVREGDLRLRSTAGIPGLIAPTLVAEDFDGSGALDLLLTVRDGRDILRVAWDVNTATEDQLEVAVGLQPDVAVTGDFDGDSRVDVALLSNSGLVVLCRQVEPRRLVVSEPHSLDWRLQALAGDVEADGRDELFVLSGASVVIAEWNAEGFATKEVVNLREPGDFELRPGSDGRAVLFVLEPRNRALRILEREGELWRGQSVALNIPAMAIELVDLDADGVDDVLFSDRTSTRSLLISGRDDRGLLFRRGPDLPGVIVAARSGDLDGDGDSDLITVNLQSAGSSTLRLGAHERIDATLVPIASVKIDAATRGTPVPIAAVDFDADGRSVVLVAGYNRFGLQAWEASRAPVSLDLDFDSVPDECEPPTCDDACPRDCNANGIDDAVEIAEDGTVDCNANGVPDDCDLADLTEFGQWSDLAMGSELSRVLAAGDFDTDGRLDLVVRSVGQRGEIIFDAESNDVRAPIDHFGSLHTAHVHDFNGDGAPDLLATGVEAGSRVFSLVNDDGILEEEDSIEFLSTPRIYWIGDWDGDERADALVRATDAEGTQSLEVISVDEHGSLELLDTDLEFEASAVDLVSGDLDGDGFGGDIAYVTRESIHIALGDGFSLDDPETMPLRPTTLLPAFGESCYFERLALSDVNSDGHVDVITTCSISPRSSSRSRASDVRAILSLGDGEFAVAPAPLVAGNEIYSRWALIDVDGDADDDLLVLNRRQGFGERIFEIHLNDGGQFELRATGPGTHGDGDATRFFVGQLDGDRSIEIVSELLRMTAPEEPEDPENPLPPAAAAESRCSRDGDRMESAGRNGSERRRTPRPVRGSTLRTRRLQRRWRL